MQSGHVQDRLLRDLLRVLRGGLLRIWFCAADDQHVFWGLRRGLLRLLDRAGIEHVHRPVRGGLLLPSGVYVRDAGVLRGGLLRRDDGPHHIDVHGAVRRGLLWLDGNCAHVVDLHRAVCSGLLVLSRVDVGFSKSLRSGDLQLRDGPLHGVHGAVCNGLLLLVRVIICDADALCWGVLWLNDGPHLLHLHGDVCGGLLRLGGDCAHIADVYRPLRCGLLLPGWVVVLDTVTLRGWLLRRDDGPHHIDVHGAVRRGLLWHDGTCAHVVDLHRAVCSGLLVLSRVDVGFSKSLCSWLLWCCGECAHLFIV